MIAGQKEAEFRSTFGELGENEQDRLMDVARAFSFAVKTRYPEGQPVESGGQEQSSSRAIKPHKENGNAHE
jgi:hypothetical protein